MEYDVLEVLSGHGTGELLPQCRCRLMTIGLLICATVFQIIDLVPLRDSVLLVASVLLTMLLFDFEKCRCFDPSNLLYFVILSGGRGIISSTGR